MGFEPLLLRFPANCMLLMSELLLVTRALVLGVLCTHRLRLLVPHLRITDDTCALKTGLYLVR